MKPTTLTTTFAILSIVATVAACAAPAEDDDTDNGGSAQSAGCGSPASRTPIAAKNYVMTAPGDGDVFARLYMDAATGKFKAAKTAANGDESLISGSFSIIAPRCQTSDRMLTLDTGDPNKPLTFNVKPLASGSLEFTETPPRGGRATYAKFEMQAIVEGESRFSDLGCVKPADCPSWAAANRIAVPRCGQWTCVDNACKHSSDAVNNAGAPRSSPSSCQ